ncbi:kinase-like domain-containing protein [Cristinia sonorae]|uniref:Kinase-like domain-containing protein n=1 Tax=Cristinia sonorae TaxID=1940300 RepID=A0A8K0UTI4_9AGAR|nr:kinase-like domain-containing protein [Cristinia sonorae]
MILSQGDIQRYIESASSRTNENELPPLPATDRPEEAARMVLDEIWKVLDSPILPVAATGPSFYSYRNQLRRLSVRMAIVYNTLPTLLFLRGVTCHDIKPRAEGGFADVFCGTYNTVKVGLKRLRAFVMMSDLQRQNIKIAFYRESLLWKNLRHEHVLPFLGVAEDVFPEALCMVIPWTDNGNLRQYIYAQTQQEVLTDDNFASTVNIWLYQTALGLDYLHGEGIVHGDLHAGNILVDGTGRVRLTDFGMSLISEATPYNYGSLHGGGAVLWSAPELFHPEQFGMESSRPTFQSDMYAFGCVIIELYTGQVPFASLDWRQVIMRVVSGKRPPRPSPPLAKPISDELWSLTTACWHHTPATRPTASTVAHWMECILKGVNSNLFFEQRIENLRQAVNDRINAAQSTPLCNWLLQALDRTIDFYRTGPRERATWVLALDKEYPEGAFRVNDESGMESEFFTRACLDHEQFFADSPVIAPGTTDKSGAIIYGYSSVHHASLYEILVTSSKHVRWRDEEDVHHLDDVVSHAKDRDRVTRVFVDGLDKWHLECAAWRDMEILVHMGSRPRREVLCYHDTA